MTCTDCKGKGSTPDDSGENQGCSNCAGWGDLDPERAKEEKPFLGILHEAKCIICGGLLTLCPHGSAKEPKLQMKDPSFDRDHDDLGAPTEA